MKYKDLEILNAIRNGNDHKALEALYRSLFPKIRKLVNTGDEKEEECKDILQEALLIFYKQVMTNRFEEKYEVEGFIYSVAKNLWINRVKKRSRIVAMENGQMPEISESNILDELEIYERKVLVRNIFNRLEERCKKLLTYTIFEELSMNEVAIKMGFTSANAATVASYRCKKHLIELARKSRMTEHL